MSIRHGVCLALALLTLVACEATVEEGVSADSLPAETTDLPGNTMVYATGFAELDPEGDASAWLRPLMSIEGATIHRGDRSVALFADGQRVGWNSLAESRNFLDAWRRLGDGDGTRFAYVDMQLMADILRKLAGQRSVLPSSLRTRVEKALNLEGVTWLAGRADQELSEVVLEIGHTGRPVGVVGTLAAPLPASARRMLLPAPDDSATVALDAWFDEQALQRSVSALVDGDDNQGMALDGMFGALRPLLRSTARLVRGDLSVRVDQDRFVAVVGVTDTGEVEDLLDHNRMIASVSGAPGRWRFGSVSIEIDEERSAAIIWAAGGGSASRSGEEDEEEPAPALAEPGDGALLDRGNLQVQWSAPQSSGAVVVAPAADAPESVLRIDFRATFRDPEPSTVAVPTEPAAPDDSGEPSGGR